MWDMGANFNTVLNTHCITRLQIIHWPMLLSNDVHQSNNTIFPTTLSVSAMVFFMTDITSGLRNEYFCVAVLISAIVNIGSLSCWISKFQYHSMTYGNALVYIVTAVIAVLSHNFRDRGTREQFLGYSDHKHVPWLMQTVCQPAILHSTN